MPVNTHLSRIAVTVNLDAVVAQEQGFNVLYLVPLASNSLNSATYVEYTSYADAVADNTAGYISSTTLQALSDVFSQTNVPERVYVAAVDLVGGDTYDDGVTAMLAEADVSFYGICIQDRSDAAITAVSAQVEALTEQKLFFCQSDDTDWLSSGHPAGLSALDGRERTVVVFHDTDAEHNDLIWATDRLSFDPDQRSVPWNAPLQEIVVTGVITSAQRTALLANYGNYAARLNATFPRYMDPGYNQNGRQIAEMVSADWFAIRVQERLAQLLGERTQRGEKIPVSQVGVSLVEGVIRRTYQQGVQAGHFEPDQLLVSSPTINANGTVNASDIAAQQIRITASIQLTTGAIQFAVTANLSRTAVNS